LNAFVLGSDYLALPREPELWLVEGLLPVGGSMLIFGDPKAGKSFAALQLACCVTSGVEWLGFACPQPRKVAYIQLDTPRSLWADRVQSLATAGHPVEGVHFADRETLETHPFDILRDEHLLLLQEALKGVQPGAVIVDTIREAHSADENDSTEMQQAIARLEAAVKPAAMILVAHARKSNPDQPHDIMNDNRGSNYIVGRMDAICRFWSNKDATTGGMRVSSRTTEEHSLKLNREGDGTWTVNEEPTTIRIAREIIAMNPHSSEREMSRALHNTLPEKTEVAWRAWLRRQA
jgi:RecA-family ATPase